MDKLKSVPDLPGAYTMRDAEGNVLYVGKARSLRKRLRQHFRENATPYGWSQQLYPRVDDIEYTVTASEVEAFILEANLIKEHKPRYNIRLADDKSYPYLKLTDEVYPRLMVLRDLPANARVRVPGRAGARRFHDPHRHEVHGTGSGRIFGPYPDTSAMRRIMQMVPKLFGLRDCRRNLDGTPNGKPCLNLHIGRCVGPCRGEEFVSREQYGAIVEQTVRFLEGKSAEIVRDLESQMHDASANLDFERAAILRDRIKAVGRVTQDQLMVANENRDQDVIGAAVQEDTALVAFLQVRAGRLVKQDQFPFAHAKDRSLSDVVDAFLTQHYARAAYIPPEILVCADVGDEEEWSALLSEARGSKVRVYRPQRGEKRRLMELAVKNAEIGLRAHLQSREARRQASAAALNDLAAALGLPEPPARIECFDISTTQGRHSTGSQVVFTDGLPDKRGYRHYRMTQTEGKPDDYAMMAEMLMRRLSRGLQEDPHFLPMPDLILVDGGKGQLSTALEVLRKAGVEHIPVAGLAKQEEEVFVPGRSFPVDMGDHQQGHLLLQRIRDEAHRFAITHHRGLRDAQITRSALEDIPGVGPERRRALLQAFASVQEIAHASVDQLAAVKGMDHRAAQAVLDALTAGPELMSERDGGEEYDEYEEPEIGNTENERSGEPS